MVTILTNLGFCNKFVNWILQCISTSSLSFLVNGSSFGLIKPTKRIRREDPLSLFLYVIYTEILSRMLANKENSDLFKGVKISRTSPSISHLLYINDLIIFRRPTVIDALSFNDTFDTFSLWSSQSPNPNKSSVHFNYNTSFF